VRKSHCWVNKLPLLRVWWEGYHPTRDKVCRSDIEEVSEGASVSKREREKDRVRGRQTDRKRE